MAGFAPASGKINHPQDLESLRAEFESLSKELATLQNVLAAFEKRYATVVGVLFAELEH